MKSVVDVLREFAHRLAVAAQCLLETLKRETEEMRKPPLGPGF